MEYRYKNIYLEETIEEIFPELNNSNTEYKRSTFVLLYKPYENIEVYIYLKFGKVRLIKIFDENFQIDNTLKVGIALTDEIINRYDLYYDDFEEVYLSKKYKELVVIVDLADNIIGFSFSKGLEGEEKSPLGSESSAINLLSTLARVPFHLNFTFTFPEELRTQ